MSSAVIFARDESHAAELRQSGYRPLDATGYWGSPAELRHEAEFVKILDHLRATPSPLKFSAEWLAQRRQEFMSSAAVKTDAAELDEQLHAVFDMLARKKILSVITGPPGAAKSTVASLWTKIVRGKYPDLPLLVMTQERPALQRLRDKIAADHAQVLTVEEALKPETTWPQNAAIIIDEAGLFGTETLAQLLQRADKAQAVKIILIGDDRQLVSNHSGQPFRWLCQQPDTDSVALSYPFRQKNPQLRSAVQFLYQGEVAAALALIPCHFSPQAQLAKTVRALADKTTPDKTMIAVHGPLYLQERLRNSCQGFRVFSLAASQGLAIDGVILVLAQKTDRAELLVGCSRQRYTLDIVADGDLFNAREALAAAIAPFPKNLMALDVIAADALLKLTDI